MLHQNNYKVLGQILATMLVQEGPPINIFTPALVAYLVTGSTDGIQPKPSEATGNVRVGLEKVISVIPSAILLNHC